MVQSFKRNFLLIILVLILKGIENSFGRVVYPFQDINIPINYSSAGCSIDIHNDDILLDPQPVLLIPGTNRSWEPKPNGIIYIPSGETIELFCSKSFNTPFKGQKLITPVCVSSTVFMVKNEEYSFDDFTCTDDSFSLAQRTGEKCHDGASLVRIGFAIDTERFLKSMEICHDERMESTLYSHYEMTPSTDSFQKGVTRVSFIEGDFYKDKDVDYLYKQKIQKQTIGEILDYNPDKYFDEKKLLYLARGHLSAKSEHIYAPQQRSTFYFLNAAPQWQKFNAGNWERIETSVRRFVAQKTLKVDVYTGTWDILTLPDVNGNNKKLFLSVDKNNNHQIPVPKFYYKVIIDKVSKRGIVLIGVNNPHLTNEQIDREYIICTDVGEKIRWINWKKTNILDGYSYACDVNQFTKVVNHLPKLEVSGLLL